MPRGNGGPARGRSIIDTTGKVPAAIVMRLVLGLLETQADFRFFLEYGLFLEAYRAAQPTEAARLDKYIRAGRVELGAEWSGIYVTQEDEEDLLRNILYAKAYAREHYGIELDTLQLTDIPGVVPQLPQVCAGLGVGNLVLTRCAPPDKLGFPAIRSVFRIGPERTPGSRDPATATRGL